MDFSRAAWDVSGHNLGLPISSQMMTKHGCVQHELKHLGAVHGGQEVPELQVVYLLLHTLGCCRMFHSLWMANEEEK